MADANPPPKSEDEGSSTTNTPNVESAELQKDEIPVARAQQLAADAQSAVEQGRRASLAIAEEKTTGEKNARKTTASAAADQVQRNPYHVLNAPSSSQSATDAAPSSGSSGPTTVGSSSQTPRILEQQTSNTSPAVELTPEGPNTPINTTSDSQGSPASFTPSKTNYISWFLLGSIALLICLGGIYYDLSRALEADRMAGGTSEWVTDRASLIGNLRKGRVVYSYDSILDRVLRVVSYAPQGTATKGEIVAATYIRGPDDDKPKPTDKPEAKTNTNEHKSESYEQWLDKVDQKSKSSDTPQQTGENGVVQQKTTGSAPSTRTSERDTSATGYGNSWADHWATERLKGPPTKPSPKPTKLKEKPKQPIQSDNSWAIWWAAERLQGPPTKSLHRPTGLDGKSDAAISTAQSEGSSQIASNEDSSQMTSNEESTQVVSSEDSGQSASSEAASQDLPSKEDTSTEESQLSRKKKDKPTPKSVPGDLTSLGSKPSPRSEIGNKEQVSKESAEQISKSVESITIKSDQPEDTDLPESAGVKSTPESRLADQSSSAPGKKPIKPAESLDIAKEIKGETSPTSNLDVDVESASSSITNTASEAEDGLTTTETETAKPTFTRSTLARPRDMNFRGFTQNRLSRPVFSKANEYRLKAISQWRELVETFTQVTPSPTDHSKQLSTLDVALGRPSKEKEDRISSVLSQIKLEDDASSSTSPAPAKYTNSKKTAKKDVSLSVKTSSAKQAAASSESKQSDSVKVAIEAASSKKSEDAFFNNPSSRMTADKLEQIATEHALEMLKSLGSIQGKLMAEGNKHNVAIVSVQDAWDGLLYAEDVMKASDTINILAQDLPSRDLLRTYPGVVNKYETLTGSMADLAKRLSRSNEDTYEAVGSPPELFVHAVRAEYIAFLKNVERRPFVQSGEELVSEGFHYDILMKSEQSLEEAVDFLRGTKGM